MDARERQAREAVILKLIEGFPSLSGRATRGLIDAYVDASEHCHVSALNQACKRFARGEVPGQNPSYPPTAAEVAAQAAMLDEHRKRTIVPLHTGVLNIDFGHGRIDMRGLTEPEQDRIIELGGKTPDGRNFALLSLADKRAALDQKALPNRVPVPRLRKV